MIMKFDAILLAIFLAINSQLQIADFEKQALATVQRRLASSFDERLPERPLARWFKEIVGERAGVLWQLSECGGLRGTLDNDDIPACAEANALLPDGSMVVVRFRVGTFKGRLDANPAFFSAVVVYKHQFYEVQRLRDLSMMLHRRHSRPVTLPAVDAKWVVFKPGFPLPPFPTLGHLPEIPNDGSIAPGAMIPPQQLQKVAEGMSRCLALTRSIPVFPVRKVSEDVAQGWALTKFIPAYPESARRMRAYGPVEVRIILSQEGKVIDAAAISGHLALRSAAVATARRWIFKPLAIDGMPVKVESILTFDFARGSTLGRLRIFDIERPKDLISSPH